MANATTLAMTTVTATVSAVENLPPHKTPLLWSFLLQLLCSIIICFIVHHTYRRVRRHFMARVIELEGQLKRMEARLRMQQPNISLISQIAHKMRMPLDEEAGEKNRVTHLVEGAPPPNDAPRPTLLPPPMVADMANLPSRQLAEPFDPEPEATQASSIRVLKSRKS